MCSQHGSDMTNPYKSLAQAILPNHWHTPPCTGNSAKSLVQELLPNHWHEAPPQTSNSAKSLALYQQAILPNRWHRQFCQITGTHLHMTIKAILPNHWHRQFCQITGMPLHPPHTSNSAKLLEHCSLTILNSAKIITGMHLHNRKFCQIAGTLLHINRKAVLLNHWHSRQF